MREFKLHRTEKKKMRKSAAAVSPTLVTKFSHEKATGLRLSNVGDYGRCVEIHGFPKYWDDEKVQGIVTRFGEISKFSNMDSALRTGKRSFFVMFGDQTGAVRAIDGFSGLQLDGLFLYLSVLPFA